MIKIYFAGSITGGRNDQEIYFELIDHLKTKGSVLTEHLANSNLSSYGETHISLEEIYTRDVNWIKESDIVIAEVTQVSLGVGYELGYAESLGKKMYCFYREKEGTRLSAMLSGNPRIKVIKYKNISEAKEEINKIFSEIK